MGKKDRAMTGRIAAIAVLLACLPAVAAAGLIPIKASYEGSVSLGTLGCQMTLTQDADGSYTLRSTSHAVGFAAMFVKDVVTETSRFEMVDGRPRPLEYSYTRSG